MGSKLRISALSLILFLSAFTINADVFDVTKYGAVEGGKSDISPFMLSAFKAACNCSSPSQLLVPEGLYGLSTIEMSGPCQAPIEFKIDGTLQAPADPKAFKTNNWVVFKYMENVTVTGNGIFDGQGPKAWEMNNCAQNTHCASLPISIRFDFIKNALIEKVTSLNSKNFHVNVLGSENVTFSNVNITAPIDAPNTDGIHIGRSKNIKIIDTMIGTGDDCVSIGEGSEQINVTKVTCGPGHGISIGSLGKYAKESPVVDISVTNCTFKNTMFGARIKSWPSNPAPGNASGMHYKDLVMDNVQFPILIDQEYCPSGQCNLKTSSTIKISDVSFRNIRGTSSSPFGVKLACSKLFPCENVVLEDIDLKYTGTEGTMKFMCDNITPTVFGTLYMDACASPMQSLVKDSN